MADLPSYDYLDELVDIDPILLRDVAFAMRQRAEQSEAERDKERERANGWQATMLRVSALVLDMQDWCSPHGVATGYADRIAQSIIGARRLMPHGDALRVLELLVKSEPASLRDYGLAAVQAVARVRKRHRAVKRGGMVICDACSPERGDGLARYFLEPYPCDTIRALDVPADGEQTGTSGGDHD